MFLATAQLPDSTFTPGSADEEDGEEADTTSVFLPPPGGKTAPFDSTGAHGSAPSLPEPGAAPADTTTRGGPPVTKTLPGTRGGADATPAEKPTARRGIIGAHPAAIVIGLIAVHVLVVKLFAH